MTDKRTQRIFTGRHMAAILVAFFGVVITVNIIMASYALSTFGGTVVDNSYVASQHYNEWLARAAAQDRLGWERSVGVDADRRVKLLIEKDGVPLHPLQVVATLSHPLGRVQPRAMHFELEPNGALRSRTAIPAGRWRLDLTIRHGNDEARYREELQ